MDLYKEDFSTFRLLIIDAIKYSIVSERVNLPILGFSEEAFEKFVYKGRRTSVDGRKPRLLSGAFGGTNTPEEEITANIKKIFTDVFIGFDFIDDDFLNFLVKKTSPYKTKKLSFIAKYLVEAKEGSNEQDYQQNLIKGQKNPNIAELNEFFSSDNVYTVNFAEKSKVGFVFNPQNGLKVISGNDGGSSKYKGLEIIFTIDDYPYYEDGVNNSFTFYVFNTCVKNKMKTFELYPTALMPELCGVDIRKDDFLDKDNESSIYTHLRNKFLKNDKENDEDTYDFLTTLIDICIKNKHSIEDPVFSDGSILFDEYKKLINQPDIWSKVNSGIMTQFGEILTAIFVLTSNEYRNKENLCVNFFDDPSQKLFDFAIRFNRSGSTITHNFSVKARSNEAGHPVEFDNFVYLIREYYDNHREDKKFNPNHDEELDNLLRMFEFKNPEQTSQIKNTKMWPKGTRFVGKRRFILQNFIYDVLFNDNKNGFVEDDFVDVFMNYAPSSRVEKTKNDFIDSFKKLLTQDGYLETDFVKDVEMNKIEDINEYLMKVYNAAGLNSAKASPWIINETCKSKMSHFYKAFQTIICKTLNKRFAQGELDENVLTTWIHNVMAIDSFQIALKLNKTQIAFEFYDMNTGSYEFTSKSTTACQAFEHANLAIHLKN